ncbi:MAG: cysteine desulfurase family protein [Clostridia bacterium]|nr:cysteine desulfurase family protein [Clostridia bacterium]
MIYFDNSATTQVWEQSAARAYHAMTEGYFNPSAAYSAAYDMEKEVNAARSYAAACLSVRPEEIYFTSGGTESNNIAIFGTLRQIRGKARIVTTMVEHASIYETILAAAKQYQAEVVYAPLNEDGTVNINRLSEVLNEQTALVSIMHVNNELGSVNDLRQIADQVRKYAPNAVFHSDGVQAFLKTDVMRLPCDLYSVSAHKFHAPKGVGFLYVRNGVRNAGGQIGGGQERGFRSGTTNVPAILGMDTAMRLYRENSTAWHQNIRMVKERLYSNLMTLPDVVLNGPSPKAGAMHILNLSFVGVRGEVLLHALEQKEILVSTGSACSAKKIGKNRILTAVGITGARQEGAIRFSFSPMNTVEEADIAADAISQQVRFLRRYKRR